MVRGWGGAGGWRLSWVVLSKALSLFLCLRCGMASHRYSLGIIIWMPYLEINDPPRDDEYYREQWAVTMSCEGGI